MRRREHEGQRRSRRCSSYDDGDQGQGSGSSQAKDNGEEASGTSSPPAAATTKTEEKKGACRHDPDHRFEFGDALLTRLSEIRASAPWFVDMRRLQSSDVRVNQNRLQLPGWSPISRILTDAEKARVRTPVGMPVTAFDRRGQRYEMTCKLWRDDKHYRFMGQGWKGFRQAHYLTIAKEAHLTRSVTIKLWAFRSRALLRRPEVKDGGDEKEEPAGHPDGALGLVLLVLDKGEQEEVAGEEEVEVAARRGEESCATKILELKGVVALLLLWTRDD